MKTYGPLAKMKFLGWGLFLIFLASLKILDLAAGECIGVAASFCALASPVKNVSRDGGLRPTIVLSKTLIQGRLPRGKMLSFLVKGTWFS